MNEGIVAGVALGALVYFIVLVVVVLERPRPGGRARHRRDRSVGAARWVPPLWCSSR